MCAAICKLSLRLLGWKLDPRVPELSRYVLIGYPHTSNFDFVLAMLARGALQYQFKFVAKHSLFWWPLGALMRSLGGIPVERHLSTGFIGQLAERFKQAQQSDSPLVIGLMPEGTRSLRPHWKTGFYYLAKAASVPIVPAFIDYRSRQIGLGMPIYTSDDRQRDLQNIQQFYSDVHGRFPKKAAPIQFKDDSAI